MEDPLITEALLLLIRASKRLQDSRNQGHKAYQEVRDAAITIQCAIHNGTVIPTMVDSLKRAIQTLPY